MSDPDEVRRRWARRVTEEYDGWPDWPAPDAATEPARQGQDADPDAPAGRTASGWSWDVPTDELHDLDARLALRQNTGETARALRRERAYWGLDAEHE